MVNYYAPGVNFGSTSLNGAINSSVGTITLNSTSNLKSPGYIVIDRQNSLQVNTPNAREVISYTGISGNDLTGCTRAVDGSTARSHADGALVEPVLTVGMWNNLQDNLAVSLATVDGTLRPVSTATITTLTGSFANFISGASASRLTGTSLYYSSATLTNLTITNSAFASGASIVGFFPSGASGAVLTSNGNAAVPVYSGVAGLSSKVIIATRDLTAASGNVAYTGVGFTPTSIICFAGLVNTLRDSFAMVDSSKVARNITNVAANTVNLDQNAIAFCETSAGALQAATVLSFDADGFTLAWTKTASPTGTLQLQFLCFK